MHTVDVIPVILKSRKHLAISLVAGFLMVVLAFGIPILTIPGNSLQLQLSLTTWEGALFTLAFALLFGLTVGVNSYALSLSSKKGIAQSSATGLFSIVGAMFSSIGVCPLCVISVFSLIGLGTSAALFALSHQTEIVALSLALVLASLYFSAKRACAICKKC